MCDCKLIVLKAAGLVILSKLEGFSRKLDNQELPFFSSLFQLNSHHISGSRISSLKRV